MEHAPSEAATPLPVPVPSRLAPTIVDESVPGTGPIPPGTPFLICFPSAGLASTIVGHYLIRHLKLPRIATIRSALLPPASVIVDRRPNPPVRIHGSDTVIVAVSEFPAPSNLSQPLAEALLQWAQRKAVGPVVVVEGVLRRDQPEPGDQENLMGIAANPSSESLLQTAKVPVLSEGIVGGLTAELLNLASLMDRPLTVLFAATGDPAYPDYRAAARLTEVLDKMIPALGLDPAPMLEQAEVLEKMLKEAMRLHKPGAPPVDGEPAAEVPPAGPSIYG